MYLWLTTNTFLCVWCVWAVTSAPLSQGQLVFAAAALHNITINDVEPVWCRLVNHLLIIVRRALSLRLPLSRSLWLSFPSFSLSIAFVALFIRTRSIAGRVGIGGEANESALYTPCHCWRRRDSFWKDESLPLSVCVCVFVFVCVWKRERGGEIEGTGIVV